jgi:glycosyltransferase involved in cell wall biosynthesis
LLIDPYDPESIADAMRRVLSDDTLRLQLKERGLVRARHFSWERSIRRVHEIYQEVLAR